MERVEAKIAVGLFLKRQNKILLMKRENTGFEDEMYEFVGGHLEENESLKDCIIREAKEEVGIEIKKENLQFLTVMYCKTHKNYINFYFLCEEFRGEIQNCEPNKCSDVKWFELENLPENLGDIAKRVIWNYENGIVLDDEYEE